MSENALFQRFFNFIIIRTVAFADLNILDFFALRDNIKIVC